MSAEKTYWSRDIVTLLDIGNSTLRKWCILLENNGYVFLRDTQDRRSFTDRDLDVLRLFKILTQDKGVALEIAALTIIEQYPVDPLQVVTPSVPSEKERSNGVISQLLEHIDKQEVFNRQLLEAMNNQQMQQQELINELKNQRTYIDDSLKQRDLLLLQNMRDALETKKLLAEEDKKRSHWWQFWGK